MIIFYSMAPKHTAVSIMYLELVSRLAKFYNEGPKKWGVMCSSRLEGRVVT